MGSFKDRGGKATLTDAIGAMMDLLILRIMLLSTVGTTGLLWGCRHSHDWRTTVQVCPLDINDYTVTQAKAKEVT